MTSTSIDNSTTMHLTDDAAALVHLMSQRAGLSAERLVEIAVREKAERDGALDELQDQQDADEAIRRLADNREPNVLWSQESPDWPAILDNLLINRSQRTLAKELGTSQAQIWRWLTGTTPIKPYQKVLLEMWNEKQK
jgi:hypothetical protein